MVWKIWTENSRTGDCGGVYLFADESAANDFLKEHLPRLDSMGIKDVRAKVLDVTKGLSHTSTDSSYCGENGVGLSAKPRRRTYWSELP
jgi:hypothetical protein